MSRSEVIIVHELYREVKVAAGPNDSSYCTDPKWNNLTRYEFPWALVEVRLLDYGGEELICYQDLILDGQEQRSTRHLFPKHTLPSTAIRTAIAWFDDLERYLPTLPVDADEKQDDVRGDLEALQ